MDSGAGGAASVDSVPASEIIAGSASGASGAVAAAGCAPVRAAEPYKIDVIIPMTGGGSFLGMGTKTTLDVLTAFSTLVTAQVGLGQARNNYVLAVLNLNNVMGL